jgi:N-acetylated-alpha-linked acidic dipeptidase
MVSGRSDDAELARGHGFLELEPLGSGSDFTPFLQHLGIASLNIGFGGEGDSGVYHSIYDSFDHFVRFIDPDFSYGVALARVGGRMVLRLADADVLPFEFTRSAAAVARYADEVRRLVTQMREEAEARDRRLDEGVYEATARPGETWRAPKRLDPVPFLELAPLENAVARLERAARRFDAAVAARPGGATAMPSSARAELDAVLVQTERAMTNTRGLPGRPWFRNHVYAPGLYTGYDVKTLPAVREAIEQRRWQEANEQARIVAATIEGYAVQVERAAEIIR